MSAEAWKSFADWATIIFIALTVVSGSAALILGDRINEKQKLQIEELQAKNLQLEQELSPRILAIRNLANGKSNIDALKEFAGTRVILGCIHDAEALHAAGSIKWFLEKAGWQVSMTVPIDPFSPFPKIHDGVAIIPAKEGDPIQNLRVVHLIVSALSDQGWKEVAPAGDMGLDWKEPVILVGSKPPAYELLK